MANIKGFFSKLGYHVIPKQNCSQAQLIEAIEEAKAKVVEVKANRLIVFILTHGEEVRSSLNVTTRAVWLTLCFDSNY